MAAKFGMGDKVYLRLNQMNNPSNQMRRYNNTIMYVIAPMNDKWYFVSETPDNSVGYGMPAHIDEMEMRYQHVDNWDEEQWKMYKNSTTSYIGDMKVTKPEIEATADNECQAYGTHFLTAIGTVGDEIGAAVDFYNTNVDLQSEIVAVQLTVRSKGKNPSPPMKVELVGSSTFVDGMYRYGLVFSDAAE